MTKRYMATLGALALLAGCASSQITGGLAPGQTVKSNGKVIIMPVPDGVEQGGDTAGGSGVAVAASLRDALLRVGVSPMTVDAPDLASAVEQAQRLGYDYVLKAKITQWEDNATSWSAKADLAAVSAELYDAASATLVASVTHKEKSSSMKMIDDSPMRYLDKISDSIAAKLFRSTAVAKR